MVLQKLFTWSTYISKNGDVEHPDDGMYENQTNRDVIVKYLQNIRKSSDINFRVRIHIHIRIDISDFGDSWRFGGIAGNLTILNLLRALHLVVRIYRAY